MEGLGVGHGCMVVGLGGKHGGRAQRWAWWPASVAGSPDDGANGGCYFCASESTFRGGHRNAPPVEL
jgi:hypothetical protein